MLAEDRQVCRRNRVDCLAWFPPIVSQILAVIVDPMQSMRYPEIDIKSCPLRGKPTGTETARWFWLKGQMWRQKSQPKSPAHRLDAFEAAFSFALSLGALLKAKGCIAMITRRRFFALLSSLTFGWLAFPRSLAKAALAAIGTQEAKPSPPSVKRRDDGPPGYVALLCIYGSLGHWQRNPQAPRRSYNYVSWMTDDAANDLPVDTETVESWKRILRRYGPSSYQQLFPNDKALTGGTMGNRDRLPYRRVQLTASIRAGEHPIQ